jgi:hypothetical protein
MTKLKYLWRCPTLIKQVPCIVLLLRYTHTFHKKWILFPRWLNLCARFEFQCHLDRFRLHLSIWKSICSQAPTSRISPHLGRISFLSWARKTNIALSCWNFLSAIWILKARPYKCQSTLHSLSILSFNSCIAPPESLLLTPV